jgi:hypothetical protein
MKHLLLSLTFILCINLVKGQSDFSRQQTIFDSFIKDSSIEWAAYVDDTITVDKYNFTNTLVKRFINKEIKFGHTYYDSIIYFSTTRELEGFHSVISDPIYDTLGNLTGGVEFDRKSDNKVDSNIFKIHQIWYIKDRALHSYIPWISQPISIFTASNLYLGKSEHFSTCFNYKYTFKSSTHDRIVFLNTTINKYLLDSFPKHEMLKELYGRNLVETLWPYLDKAGVDVIDLRNGGKLNWKEFSINPPREMTSYDSVGNVGRRLYSEPSPPSVFKQIQITQNWYYNYSKNIVFNTISQIVLLIPKGEKEFQPIIKITAK